MSWVKTSLYLWLGVVYRENKKIKVIVLRYKYKQLSIVRVAFVLWREPNGSHPHLLIGLVRIAAVAGDG